VSQHSEKRSRKGQVIDVLCVCVVACVLMTSSVSGRRRQRVEQLAERHVTGVAGKSIVLRCDLPTSRPPSVRWIDYVYNTSPQPELISVGHELQPTHPNADKFRVDPEFSLTISSLQIDESPGQYVCQSIVDGLTHRLDYQLTVCSMSLPSTSITRLSVDRLSVCHAPASNTTMRTPRKTNIGMKHRCNKRLQTFFL